MEYNKCQRGVQDAVSVQYLQDRDRTVTPRVNNSRSRGLTRPPDQQGGYRSAAALLDRAPASVPRDELQFGTPCFPGTPEAVT